MTEITGGDTTKSNAMRLLRAIYDRTKGTDQPVFVEELGTEIGMEISVIRSSWRYLAENKLIKTFSIPYTARINAHGIDLIENSDLSNGRTNLPPAPSVQNIINIGTVVGSNIHHGQAGSDSPVTQAIGTESKIETQVGSHQAHGSITKARKWSKWMSLGLSLVGTIAAVLSIPGVLNDKLEKPFLHDVSSISPTIPTASSVSTMANNILPVVDVERFCKDSATIMGTGDSFIPVCVADEQKAERQLAEANFPARILSVCNGRFSPKTAEVSYRRLWMCAAQIRVEENRSI